MIEYRVFIIIFVNMYGFSACFNCSKKKIKAKSSNKHNKILTSPNEAYDTVEVQGACCSVERQSQLQINLSDNNSELITNQNEAYGMVKLQGVCSNAERQNQHIKINSSKDKSEVKTTTNQAYGMIKFQGRKTGET